MRIIDGIIAHRKGVVALFVCLALACACLIPFVDTNYDMVDYLPESAQSTTAVQIIDEEFSTGMPNADVMVCDVTLPQALDIKERIEAIDGVESVMWLDDVVDVYTPLETLDADTVEQYWHADDGDTGAALYQVEVGDGVESATVAALRELIDSYGEGNAVSGDASTTAQMQDAVVSEVISAVIICVPIIVVLLVLSTTSWLEPLLFFAAIGISILFNMGTNIVFGQVSFLTYSVSPILQLAVSLDYAIFLLHEFSSQRALLDDVEEAMRRAMKRSATTVATSALTTLFGFAALSFMQFQIGADLGINLVKGIVFSFITVIVFLPALTLLCISGLDATRHRRLMPTFSGVDSVLRKIRIPALVLLAVLVVPAFLGQGSTTFTYLNASPDPTTRTGADMDAIEEEFGQSNPIALLVPIGDVASEAALAEDLEQLEHVTSVVSYAGSVGAAIPSEYLDSSVLEQFYSENYARIVVYIDTDAESEAAFATVQAIEDAALSYYDVAYAAGQSANLYDMAQVVSVDNQRVTWLAIIAIFIVLMLTFRSLSLPFILLLVIESGIWINLSIPYFTGETINFIGYLVVNTVQLGATIDYAILLSTAYMRHRRETTARESARLALGECFRSIFISAAILASAGFALAATSSLSAVTTLGILLGRGTIMSFVLVTCVLPALLILCDGLIRKTTLKAGFYTAAGAPAPETTEGSVERT